LNLSLKEDSLSIFSHLLDCSVLTSSVIGNFRYRQKKSWIRISARRAISKIGLAHPQPCNFGKKYDFNHLSWGTFREINISRLPKVPHPMNISTTLTVALSFHFFSLSKNYCYHDYLEYKIMERGKIVETHINEF
jgi:hypothetical protein